MVRDYEPHQALFAGEDGLDDYRIIIPALGDVLTQNGIALLEIGHRQADAVTGLAKEYGFNSTMLRDLAERPRALILRAT
ncbi:MAG: peptide chain release factor N(5)-glutamine methyltransferase, partial [Pontixanthobacter sp.]